MLSIYITSTSNGINKLDGKNEITALTQLPRIYKCIIRLQSSMMIRKNRSFKFKYSRSKKIAERLLTYYFIHAISRLIVYINTPRSSSHVHNRPASRHTYTSTHSRRKIATRVHVVLMKNDILRSFVGYSRIPRILKNSHVPCPSSITRKNLACIFIDKQPTRLIVSAEKAISRRRFCDRLTKRSRHLFCKRISRRRIKLRRLQQTDVVTGNLVASLWQSRN